MRVNGLEFECLGNMQSIYLFCDWSWTLRGRRREEKREREKKDGIEVQEGSALAYEKVYTCVRVFAC